jgi:hypothetical protein
MKPIYFPFTDVSDPVAAALAACFGQFVVYRPTSEKLSEQMQLWVDRRVMDVRVPVTGHENELKVAVKNYQIWADLHREGSSEKAAALTTRQDSMPLFSEFSSSKIVEDIKDKVHGNANTEMPDPVLAARIFLYIAQEFDRQNHELSDDLNRYRQREADLIRELKMEDDPVAGEFRIAPSQAPDPFADHLVSDRLTAWTRIFCQDREDSVLFVTHRPAILDHLLDQASNATRVISSQSIPPGPDKSSESSSWQEKLSLYLSRYVEPHPAESSGRLIELIDLQPAESNVSLSVYLVPDQSPRDFFVRCAGIKRPAEDGAGLPDKFKNTLIALIEPSLSASIF